MKRLGLLISFVMVASLLASCGTPTPEVVERVVTQVVVETVEETVLVEGTPQVVEVTRVVEVEKVVTATPGPEMGPAPGGTLVIATSLEQTTLDPQVSTDAAGPIRFLGATLLAMDAGLNLVPYLAESWEVSEDGLMWDFHLRHDVLFHDGTPLTAQDYAWTFNRILDPETAATTAAAMAGPVLSAEAVDDYTLRLNLAMPSASLLTSLSSPYLQPLSQAAVEAAGEQAGRSLVGVGPYRLVEWATNDKIVLERNPDYVWAPEFVHQGAPYVERLEFRYIPEPATVLAALEAGEVDFARVAIKDVERLRETGQFRVLEDLFQGMTPGIVMNITMAPFDDLRVRQALNMAVDRDTLIRVVLGEGNGVPQYGPLSATVAGYWPGVEYIGYHFDPDRALALLEEAGYVANDDGILTKDGELLKLELAFSPGFTDPRVAEVLQQQFRALGIDVELVQMEFGVMMGAAIGGELPFHITGYEYFDAMVMGFVYHSSQIGGGLNLLYWNDPETDRLLEAMETAPDGETRDKYAADVQRRLVEEAVAIPLYAEKRYSVLNNRVMGDIPFITVESPWWNDAYIDQQ